jgi:hypothetical protein
MARIQTHTDDLGEQGRHLSISPRRNVQNFLFHHGEKRSASQISLQRIGRNYQADDCIMQEIPRTEIQNPSTHKFIVKLPKKKPKEVDVEISFDKEAGKVRLSRTFHLPISTSQ